MGVYLICGRLNDNSSILIILAVGRTTRRVYSHGIGCLLNTCICALLFQQIKYIASCLFGIFVWLLLLCNLVVLALSLQVTGFSQTGNKHNAKQKIRQKQNCVGRESNPGQLLGRQLCSPLYHRRAG